MELASRELEVARLQQALTNRVWIEQAKGVLAATQGTDPQAACQQLRARARASSRELAELAREVVQGAQRQRLGALALDDVRVREAEARAQAAEQAQQAAQADLVQRRDGMVARRPASGGRAGEEQAMGGNQAVSAGPPPEGIAVGEDGIARCWWGAGDPLYRRYHDQEWGRPVAEDRRLFEKLSLEGFQAGLSWLTILRKRERFREVFAGFDPVVVARFGVREVDRLLADPGIVRNRAKIEATINNAGRYGELAAEFGSLAAYVWRFEPGPQARPPVLDHASLLQLGQSSESKAMSKDLRRRGWSFVGPTTVYAFMEAMGLVNDHLEGCGCRPAVERERHRFRRPKVAAGGTRSRSRPPS